MVNQALEKSVFGFGKDYYLKNEKVQLRPIRPSDLFALVQFAIFEPEIWHYNIVRPNTTEEMFNYIYDARKGRKLQTQYTFVISEQYSNTIAGSSRYYDMDVERGYCKIGYTWLGKKYQGTGINKHCKYLMLDFAFSVMQMCLVEFRVDVLNTKSIAALKRIGIQEKSLCINTGIRLDGTQRDSLVFGIEKLDWMDGIKDALLQQITV